MSNLFSEATLQEQIHVKPIEASTYLYSGILDTGWHQHAEHQLIYAENGVLYVLTDESQFLLPAYHGAWVPARCAHKLESPSEETKLWLLYFQPREVEVAVLQNVRIFGVSPLAREMILHTERWSDEGKGNEGSNALAQSFYETIWLLIAEWCERPLPLILSYSEDGLLGEITRYILENLENSLDIETVAQAHGISGRTLMRLFRNRLGTTFGTWLRIARIVKAVELLTTPSTSILDVAYTVGYNSPSSFSHAFRQLTGMTPQAYAAKCKR
ncbi:helix-turn-helix transcriptional regulator [Chloroflexi bacterium TSY]|nr:helix-turn-helix transcriptional regulator [Chloroflexi bacterium TSY]